MEPQHVIPPIEKAVQVQDAGSRVVRRLVPKRKSKDAPLDERVEYFEKKMDGGGVVHYYPLVEDPEKLPFYYPKVIRFIIKSLSHI